MKMTERYKILLKFIKDISSETRDIQTYLHVKDKITKYKLRVDINSKPLKNKMVEVNISLIFEDRDEDKQKSYFEILYTTVIKISDEIQDKKELEKIILCEVPTEIYPDLEKSFLNLLHNSGYPGIKFDKKIDFESLYNQKFN